MKSKYFKLYGNCFLVKGHKESVLYDLGNRNYYPIPNDIATILLEIEEKEISIDNLSKCYKKKTTEIIKILNYFVDNNLAYFVLFPKNFPKINLDWKSPYKIENAIIEFDNKNKYDVIELLSQLEELRCQAIEFRFVDKFNLDYLSEIFSEFKNSSFKYYFLASKYNDKISIQEYKKFAFKYKRVSNLLVFVENDKKLYQKLRKTQPSKPKVIYLNGYLESKMDEKISLNSFVINVNTFAEAQLHNIGLNRKICIDADGFVRNFINHEKSFGNVRTINLKEVLEYKEFKNKWNISNDKIEKCKDCQYRYMCLSNSDIVEKENKYYKVNSCTFNPYTNEWNK